MTLWKHAAEGGQLLWHRLVRVGFRRISFFLFCNRQTGPFVTPVPGFKGMGILSHHGNISSYDV
jgi:hypothetical protein